VAEDYVGDSLAPRELDETIRDPVRFHPHHRGPQPLGELDVLSERVSVLTTFSIANDVAKYFAIIPAMFLLAFPQLAVLNVMRLATPESAILSAVIFNAIVIIALIPLALRGVRYRPLGAAAILRRNMLIYGVGGIVAPFLGIKVIDLLLTAVGLA